MRPAWQAGRTAMPYVRAAPLTSCGRASNPSQVTDLGSVLHLIGGTAASYMIFFLPGLLLW
jgi:hypothetical protein